MSFDLRLLSTRSGQISNFHFIYSLFRENIEIKLAGEKNKLLKLSSTLYKLFSDIQFSKCFFESRARRKNVFFQNFSLFPNISMFSAHFVAYLSSLLELPRLSHTVHGHQGRQKSASSSFSLFLFLTGEGMEAKP